MRVPGFTWIEYVPSVVLRVRKPVPMTVFSGELIVNGYRAEVSVDSESLTVVKELHGSDWFRFVFDRLFFDFGGHLTSFLVADRGQYTGNHAGSHQQKYGMFAGPSFNGNLESASLDKNYEFANNEDAQITCRWTDKDGVPYAITEAYFTIKKRESDTTPIVALKKSTGGVQYDSTDHWCTALIPESMMDDIPPSTYKYDFVFVRTVDGKKDSMLHGEFVVRQGISTVA